jgi:hypothetical protein
MRFPIRPGNVTCAGIVAILMVLPNSIWKGPDAQVAPQAGRPTAETTSDSARPRVKLGKVARRAVRTKGVTELKVRRLR